MKTICSTHGETEAVEYGTLKDDGRLVLCGKCAPFLIAKFSKQVQALSKIREDRIAKCHALHGHWLDSTTESDPHETDIEYNSTRCVLECGYEKSGTGYR